MQEQGEEHIQSNQFTKAGHINTPLVHQCSS